MKHRILGEDIKFPLKRKYAHSHTKWADRADSWAVQYREEEAGSGLSIVIPKEPPVGIHRLGHDVEVRVTANRIVVTRVCEKTLRYISWMMSLLSWSNIPFSIYRKPKELSEVGSAMCYISQYKFPPRVLAYVIGDGAHPRLGLPLVLTTNWTVHVIDPDLRLAKTGYLDKLTGPDKWRERLKLHATYDYHIDVSEQTDYDAVVIAGVHSHNQMGVFWPRITRPKFLLLIPCCVKVDMEDKPDVDVIDPDIHSAHNRVLIWDRITHCPS